MKRLSTTKNFSLMNNLNWKSFAIGVLLTTTVIACTGATIVNGKWDKNQNWEIKTTNLLGEVAPVYSNKSLDGFEPFEVSDSRATTIVVWRKRIK